MTPGRLDGRWCYCLPADPARDLRDLHTLLTPPDTGWRVRYRHSTPTVEQVGEDLFGDDVAAQWSVFRQRDDVFRGWVHVGSANLLDGVAHLSLASTERSRGWGTFLEAAAHCIDDVFIKLPLRKLYSEMLTENLGQFFGHGDGKYFSVEGIRRESRYALGAYRDVALVCIDRVEWAAARAQLRA